MDRENYLATLTEQIRAKRARTMVAREVEDHIDDQKEMFLADGMTEEEAEEEAVREMGDPVEAGVALDRIHRPQMDWGVFAGIVLISLAGILLQAVVTNAVDPALHQSGIWTAVTGGVWKQLLTVAAGLLLIFLICRLDYSFIGKYAVPLFLAAHAVIVVYALAGRTVNGRLQYMLPLSCILVPFYAGLVYHFRGQGRRGLVKSVLSLAASTLLLFRLLTLPEAGLIAGVGFVVLHAAVCRKWFGKEKGKQLAVVWGLGLAVVLVLAGALFFRSGGSLLTDYQFARLEAWIHPSQYEEENFLPSAVRDAADAVRQGETGETADLSMPIRNDYFWLFLFRYLGSGTGILLTLSIVAFWGFLFRTVYRQKNQLGYMISLACVLFLALETAVYLAVNFQILPVTRAYLPFLSNGNILLLVTYFYMGIFMSVCRNRKLVKN